MIAETWVCWMLWRRKGTDDDALIIKALSQKVVEKQQIKPLVK